MRPMLFVFALAAVPVAAAPSYDYVDVSALGISFTQPGTMPDDDAVGARFRSSVAFDDEWFWTFEAAVLEYDVERGAQWRLGLGYAFPLDSMDMVVKLESGRTDLGIASGGGFAWDVQLRSAVWEHFELNAHAGQASAGSIDTFLRYGVGMLWTPGDSLGITLEYDQAVGDVVEMEGVAAGVRWSF
jgi:hypothetical protein